MRFNERVEVCQATAVSDSFGGNTAGESQLGTSWAKVNSIPREKYDDYGLNTSSKAIEIYVRSRSDIDYFDQDIFFKYQNIDWYPEIIEDYGFKDELIRIVASGKR